MSKIKQDYNQTLRESVADHRKHPIVKNYKFIVTVLIILYVVFGFGLFMTYMKTRCPYSTLSACQVAMKEKCGTDAIGTVDACANFVQNIEPCFCKECKLCLNEEQRAHCNASVEDRLLLCEKQMRAVNSK